MYPGRLTDFLAFSRSPPSRYPEPFPSAAAFGNVAAMYLNEAFRDGASKTAPLHCRIACRAWGIALSHIRFSGPHGFGLELKGIGPAVVNIALCTLLRPRRLAVLADAAEVPRSRLVVLSREAFSEAFRGASWQASPVQAAEILN